MGKNNEDTKWNKLKMDAAKEIGMAEFAADNEFTTKKDRMLRGPIGGNMVKKMIQAEEDKMAHDGKK